ncbi:MAG: indole-3-glycerol phosphate synthase TrpC, partial [Myxococcota bacterium]
ANNRQSARTYPVCRDPFLQARNESVNRTDIQYARVISQDCKCSSDAARIERSNAELDRAAALRFDPARIAVDPGAAVQNQLDACILRQPGEVRVIAEIKRASPSAGAIRAGADPAAIAREYRAAGAAALSVLTDEQFFDGRLAFLGQVREAVDLPLLRKDFLIDPYQVVEARAAGADAVLLIVAALDQDALNALLAETRRLGMDALVEIHSEDEAARAVAAGAEIIGVNHRDLTTFTIDMSLSGRLRPQIPAQTIMVGESGIGSADDVRALGAAGVDAVLVGERLMRAESPGQALRQLRGVAAS